MVARSNVTRICPCQTQVENPGPHISSCPWSDPDYEPFADEHRVTDRDWVNPPSVMVIPPRRKRRKFGDPLPDRPLERDIREQIRGAINRLPYARVWVNRERKNARGIWEPGLCPGSADLIGYVTQLRGPAVFFAIETKTRQHRTNVSYLQRDWLDHVNDARGVAGVAYCLKQALILVGIARCASLDTVVGDLERIVGRKVDLGDE